MLLVHLKTGLYLTIDEHLILNTKAVILLISFFLAFFMSASLLPLLERGDGGEKRKWLVGEGGGMI